MPSRRARRRWCAPAVLLAVMASAFLFRAPLLRSAASLLIVDQPADQAQNVVILGGDSRYRIAAGLVHRGQCQRILIFEGRKSQLVRDRIVKPEHQVAREQILRHGVLPSGIVMMPGETRNLWEVADRLQRWLDAHPGAHAVALADRFRSRSARLVLDSVLTDPMSRRVAVRALRDRRYDETDWWHSREGWKSLFGSLCGMAAIWINGRPDPDRLDRWDPDAYEAWLRRHLSVRR